jgi:hypothetical protein
MNLMPPSTGKNESRVWKNGKDDLVESLRKKIGIRTNILYIVRSKMVSFLLAFLPIIMFDRSISFFR